MLQSSLLAGSLPAVISAAGLSSSDRSSLQSPLPKAGATKPKLALGELEALARALLPVLLAFLHTGVTRQKTVLAQRSAQLRIELRDGARQSHADRTGLPADAAAIRGHHNVYLVREAREFQRLDGVMLPSEVREILLHRPLVDCELARAGAQKHARNRFLAAARSQKPACARYGRTR